MKPISETTRSTPPDYGQNLRGASDLPLKQGDLPESSPQLGKFTDPFVTAQGETRASVDLKKLETLWFNTGTRCNLSCENCYIESNPKNDRLSFLTVEDIRPYLAEVAENDWQTREIGLTGGEPLLNPHIIDIIETCLSTGLKTLLLTNALRINRYKKKLQELAKHFGKKFLVRISLDHYTAHVHEKERGPGTFSPTLTNIQWMKEHGIPIAIAGRQLNNEDPMECRQGYIKMLETAGIDLDFSNKQDLVIFAEMNPKQEVPEITTACWDILKKSPDDMMCSSSRMVVKAKGEKSPKVLACTLLAYDKQFEMGDSLKTSGKRVQLNHKFCAQFCVLGGSSCS